MEFVLVVTQKKKRKRKRKFVSAVVHKIVHVNMQNRGFFRLSVCLFERENERRCTHGTQGSKIVNLQKRKRECHIWWNSCLLLHTRKQRKFKTKKKRGRYTCLLLHTRKQRQSTHEWWALLYSRRKKNDWECTKETMPLSLYKRDCQFSIDATRLRRERLLDMSHIRLTRMRARMSHIRMGAQTNSVEWLFVPEIYFWHKQQQSEMQLLRIYKSLKIRFCSK